MRSGLFPCLLNISHFQTRLKFRVSLFSLRSHEFIFSTDHLAAQRLPLRNEPPVQLKTFMSASKKLHFVEFHQIRGLVDATIAHFRYCGVYFYWL
jgi:hypothetical protein